MSLSKIPIRSRREIMGSALIDYEQLARNSYALGLYLFLEVDGFHLQLKPEDFAMHLSVLMTYPGYHEKSIFESGMLVFVKGHPEERPRIAVIKYVGTEEEVKRWECLQPCRKRFQLYPPLVEEGIPESLTSVCKKLKTGRVAVSVSAKHEIAEGIVTNLPLEPGSLRMKSGVILKGSDDSDSDDNNPVFQFRDESENGSDKE